MKRISLLVIFLLAASSCLAACPVMPSNKACLQWVASSGWNDGTPFAAGTVVTYRVYQVDKVTGGLQQLLGTTQALQLQPTGLSLGEKCFAVVTVVSPTPTGFNSTSSPSNTACKTLRFPGPTEGSIAAPSDGSIEQPKK